MLVLLVFPAADSACNQKLEAMFQVLFHNHVHCLHILLKRWEEGEFLHARFLDFFEICKEISETMPKDIFISISCLLTKRGVLISRNTYDFKQMS